MFDRLSMRRSMRFANARGAGLKGPALDMYLDGKAKLCRAIEVSKKAKGGKGYESPTTRLW